MCVVVGTSGNGNEDTVIFPDASDVRPESWLNFFRNRGATVFRAEDDVEVVLRVSMRHL